jgi:AraC family transcriptional regulator, regulatory protein of adaptative response / methylated-DNA-[protein]-cysteine methyltransferase
MNHYEQIARVIRYLDTHYAEQPDLATLAEVTGLSPAHFHRLFSSWAGVTPKDFLQCLTLSHAKELLQGGTSVLATSLQSGLSGPGRLHDLCVSLEAASPGELKSGGTEWLITGGFGLSPFGMCLIAEGPRGICHVAFLDAGAEKEAWAELVAAWPNSRMVRDDTAAKRMLTRVFTTPAAGSESQLPLRAFVKGTAFQVRVWRALLEIPPGQVTSYGRLAAALGQPTAARAVGSAVGSNAVAFIIPCHRVIRETGVLGEYRWGSFRKRAVLSWEQARTSCAPPLPFSSKS